jgi:uncharacterized protein (TIGR02145 family)
MSVPYALYANTSGAASVNVDSILNELKSIKLVQKGDSILLNNNRGAVFVQKIDSLSQLAKQLAQLKTQYDGTTDSILAVLNKKYDSLAKVISELNNGPTIPSTSNTASTMKFISRGLDSVLMPSVYFDGLKTHISLGKTDLLSQKIYNRSFTVEAWIKSLKVSDTGQYIICNGYQGNGNVGAFGLSLYKNRIIATVGNFSGYAIAADFPNDSLWHHVVFQHNNNTKFSNIFIDGVEKYKINNSGGQGMVNGSVAIDGIGANLDLGVLAPREFFKGNLRKIRISKGLIYTADFNPSYKYGRSDSTLAFWELNEGSGTKITCSDSSYNGILYNGAWQTNDTNTVNSVRDLDGNVYKTVKIGTQIWMAENLRTTKYRDGSKITKVIDNTAWSTLTSGAYTYWGNDSATNGIVYGNLYNYYTIISTQKVCPSGWHIPSMDEFQILENYLGKDSAGTQMKTTVGWILNGNGTNKSGFSALPGGIREGAGTFSSILSQGNWWTNTEVSTSSSQMINLTRSSGIIEKIVSSKLSGASIRCIKD